jgi:hypothetical protein
MKKVCAVVLFALAGLLYPVPAHAGIVVGVELLLLVDVSGSVDNAEYALQKSGYVAAFQNSVIQSYISATPNGVAVAYAEFSGASEQAMLVNWSVLTDAASSNNFAASIGGTSRAFNGLTAPGSAINWGVAEMTRNSLGALRMVMDVSGDGSENDGSNTFSAAAWAWTSGIRVNGLPILGSEYGLDTWYSDNITVPGHGFLVVAQDFNTFETAVADKLQIDIGGDVPEPGTITLLLAGLGGLAFAKFRKR